MDSFSPEVLLALQALLSKELASRGVAASVKEASVAPPKKAAKVSKEAKEAKEPVAKRAPGAWAAWTKHAPLAHAKEYAEFKASNVGAVGIAPLFCTQWRSAHAEEYAAFELAHKASASAAPSPASVPAPAAAEPSPAKEPRKWSEEAKAKVKATNAAKKAAKALAEAPASAAAKEAVVSAAPPAPLPAAAPSAPSKAAASNPFDEEEAEAELLPFKLGGRNYQRPGVSRLGAEPIWVTGDLWEAKADGSRGDWAGVLEEDGSIDLNADEPSLF